jgi:hypothetical protein
MFYVKMIVIRLEKPTISGIRNDRSISYYGNQCKQSDSRQWETRTEGREETPKSIHNAHNNTQAAVKSCHLYNFHLN